MAFQSCSVSDTQSAADAVFQLSAFLVADTFPKGILSGTPPWLPHKHKKLSALTNLAELTHKKTLTPTTADHICFSDTYEIFIKADHILGHKSIEFRIKNK